MRAAGLAVLSWLALSQVARAEPAVSLHVLAIGYNGLPAADDDARLRELRYADDDAAAFAQFGRDVGGNVIVVSNFDLDTARRFPEVAAAARPPMREEIRRAVRELNEAFARDRARGREPVVLLTYSGHGSSATGKPALTLADGELTQEALYAEVLTALAAKFVHVVVDACHAEAVVRSRDLQGEVVTLGKEEVAAQLARATLRGLPHVGALVASSASTQTHEWDRWQHGVFTHEVISGLRGAADVNGDRTIEYSEMAAFLSAVNREVRDRTARIKPLITAPAGAPRVPIVDLRATKLAAFLVGQPEPLGALWVETDNGQRILDLRSEHQHYVRVVVPSGQRLFVRSMRGEAEVTIAAGRQSAFDQLAMRARGVRARGSLDLSLERGLFAAAFGPSYYRGFVDRTEEIAAVPLRITDPGAALHTAASPADAPATRVMAWTAAGVSGALLVASAGLGLAALDAKGDFDDANGLERASSSASDRYDDYGQLALGALVSGVIMGGVSYLLFAQD